MPDQTQDQITQLLHSVRQGDTAARSQLGTVVYQQLWAIAHGLTGDQADHHTLHPTALVNEAYLKLLHSGSVEKCPNRRYFFASAARAMRQVLADHARKKNAFKRGGRHQRVAFDSVLRYLQQENIDSLALTEALDRLEERDARKAEVVQLRFFGGLTMDEIAQHLRVSRATVELDWRAARAFLRLNLK